MSEPEQTLSFPNVTGSSLERQKFNLPKGFQEELNIVVVAFKREHAALIESWTGTLEEIEQKNRDVRFYELPVLSRSYWPLRWWIDGGMRAGIADSETRKRTITVYTTKSAFRKQLGIPNEDTIYIFLLNKSGKILWQTKGDFTEEKNQQLRHALKENK
jgi:hypothetical protein